jgi:exosortase/archaeosortase family protein
LENGGVEVYPGCSGFDMAMTMIGLSVLVGIIFHLNIKRTVMLTLASVALALILNVIRIALMTLATAYWGDEVFDFWHGSWGGQIIVGVLFTAYYYLIIWILPQSIIPTSGHNLSD